MSEHAHWKTTPETLAAGYGWRKTDKILKLAPSNLAHFGREIDVNVILTLACRQTGFEIVTWDSDVEVRRKNKDERVNYACPITGEELTTAIIPDGWYTIRDSSTGTCVNFFIEIDLGTQTLRPNGSTNTEKHKKSWRHKFAALVNFFAHGHFADVYGEEATAIVVIITTSQLRMERLQSVCSESGAGDYCLFTFFDVFTPNNVLTQPIFQRARERTWVRLFDV